MHVFNIKRAFQNSDNVRLLAVFLAILTLGIYKRGTINKCDWWQGVILLVILYRKAWYPVAGRLNPNKKWMLSNARCLCWWWSPYGSLTHRYDEYKLQRGPGAVFILCESTKILSNAGKDRGCCPQMGQMGPLAHFEHLWGQPFQGRSDLWLRKLGNQSKCYSWRSIGYLVQQPIYLSTYFVQCQQGCSFFGFDKALKNAIVFCHFIWSLQCRLCMTVGPFCVFGKLILAWLPWKR